ncbi:MAG: N-acetyltransferase [Deltaproteobacteria bacterium]|nr:MAG: N-acetyltransferase [Deltaproteobacteria bacterium]
MELRRLDPSEAERLRALRLRSLRADPLVFGGSYDESAARPLSVWERQVADLPTWVVSDGDADVGMVRIAPHAEGGGELISLWVAPEARGRGVGERLVHAVLAWADGPVVLEVRASNGPAIDLYERLGFTLDAETEGTQRWVRATRSGAGAPR